MSNTFTPEQKIRVSDDAPHNAGRMGYFEFKGGPNDDIVVLRLAAHKREPHTLIAIAEKHAIKV
jgi:hypothetical protein